jgi:hypothetical protein
MGTITVQIMINQKKKMKNVKYFNYLCSMITNDARCTLEIKFRVVMTKAAFNRKKSTFTGKLDLYLRKKLVQCCTWSTALCGAEN